MKKTLNLVFITLFFIGLGSNVSAQEMVTDRETLVPARVIEITDERMETLPTSDAEFLVQTMRAKILRGDRQGEVVILENDYAKMKNGSRFIMRVVETTDGMTVYGVADFERRPAIVLFFVLFVGLVIGLGRMQGVRSLVSLGVSMLAIFFVLIPLLLKGWNPVVVSTAVSAAILFFAIFFTHGFNRKSTIAFSGTVAAVVITGILAAAATAMARITGFSSHESVYLNFNTGGTLDFVGLYLAGVMIGMLGVLDDISITQVAVVRELYGVASHLTKREIFASAIRVGKEHVGALVNTLVLAYVGVALPSVMYFATGDAGVGQTINMEIFASEILRTILGSIGLILTVPITTYLAVIFMKQFKGQKMTLDELEHGHSHSHHGHHH